MSKKSASSSDHQKWKSRVLILSTRGITSRHRHFLKDLEALLPHSKKEAKLDGKSNLDVVNELAELNGCDHAIVFEARKKQDLYLWASCAPNGPTVKFLVQNLHTTDELKLTGNCLKGSRPIISIDPAMTAPDAPAHLQLIAAVLERVLCVPTKTRRGKPFIDHVINIAHVDGRVWFRNYQIVEKDPSKTIDASTVPGVEGGAKDGMSLVEIGPRCVLHPILILAGSFNGAVLYKNPEYVSPNAVRAAARKSKAGVYVDRKLEREDREERFEKVKDAHRDEVEEVFEN